MDPTLPFRFGSWNAHIESNDHETEIISLENGDNFSFVVILFGKLKIFTYICNNLNTDGRNK